MLLRGIKRFKGKRKAIVRGVDVRWPMHGSSSPSVRLFSSFSHLSGMSLLEFGEQYVFLSESVSNTKVPEASLLKIEDVVSFIDDNSLRLEQTGRLIEYSATMKKHDYACIFHVGNVGEIARSTGESAQTIKRIIKHPTSCMPVKRIEPQYVVVCDP